MHKVKYHRRDDPHIQNDPTYLDDEGLGRLRRVGELNLLDHHAARAAPPKVQHRRREEDGISPRRREGARGAG